MKAISLSSWLAAVISLSISFAFAAAPDDDDLLLIIPSIVASKNPEQNVSGDLCKGFVVNDKSDRPMPPLSKPAPLGTYTDPVFGSKITRISNSDGVNSGIVKTLYSTIQAWNADESRMLLWHRQDGHYLYDGNNYSLLERLEIVPADIEQVFWSTTNPNLLYYPNEAVGRTVKTINNSYRLKGNELMEYNITTRNYRVLKDFNTSCPGSSGITAGNDVQMIAYNNDVIGLRCGEKGFVHQISSNTTTELSGSAGVESPQPFPSGKRSYHQGRVLNQSLKTERELDLGKVDEHASLGRLHNGNDAYFAVAFGGNKRNSCGDGVGSLVAHDASNGSCQVLIGQSNGYPYTLSGTHISAVAHKKPGWAVISSVGYGLEGDTLLEQELYLANTDPTDLKVCRIAHHRSSGRLGSIGYFAEPHPVISPSGTRLLFNSDWNNSGKVDVYVVELPEFRRFK